MSRGAQRTTELCKEISQGYAVFCVPLEDEISQTVHPDKGAGIPRTLVRVRILRLKKPGVREKRVPLANVLAPLRGAVGQRH
jgi:hypothetical protein